LIGDFRLATNDLQTKLIYAILKHVSYSQASSDSETNSGGIEETVRHSGGHDAYLVDLSFLLYTRQSLRRLVLRSHQT